MVQLVEGWQRNHKSQIRNQKSEKLDLNCEGFPGDDDDGEVEPVDVNVNELQVPAG